MQFHDMQTPNTENKTAVISARILAHVAAGLTLPEAMDEVLGAGTFAEIAGTVYETLRK